MKKSRIVNMLAITCGHLPLIALTAASRAEPGAGCHLKGPDDMPDLALLIGRCLIAALFLAGFVQKIADPGAAMMLLEERALPTALIWPATLYNGAAALALILGLWTRPVAASLAVYCIATSLFHLKPDDPWQMSIFVKNWAIAGGCLALSAAGPGRFARMPLR